MFRIILVALACALITPASVVTQSSALDAAAKTLGTAGLRSLQFTATGQSFVLGQPPTAAEAWPVRPVKSYQVFIDYGSNSMRLEQVLTMPTPQPRGGGAAVRANNVRCSSSGSASRGTKGRQPPVHRHPAFSRSRLPLPSGCCGCGPPRRRGQSRQPRGMRNIGEASPTAPRSRSRWEAGIRSSR